MRERKQRPPGRLASRIRWLLVSLALFQAILSAWIGWMLLLTAEEHVKNQYYGHVLQSVAQAGPAAPLPAGVVRYTSSEAISEALGLANPPTKPGLYAAFRDDTQHRTEVMQGVLDYLYWSDWNEEYVIWVESAGTGQAVTWLVSPVDEYTDGIAGSFQVALLIVALVVMVVALSVGSLIATWALKPIVALAERVQKRNPDIKADPPSPGRVARVAHDEVDFLEGTLEAYEARLRESLARERDFLSDCSHELRTPVATLKGAVSLLRTSTDDAARERYLGRMDRSVHRMERLIEIFLMVAREDDRRAASEEINAAQVVGEVVDEIRALYPTHPLRIGLFVDPTVTIVCHREALSVLCHNLIGNAFSHLPGGEMCVRVESMDGAVRLRVEDDGPGLPEFRNTAMASAPGHGHGMMLVERLCRTQRWRLNKVPHEQGGTCIEVSFPRPRP